jgi:serine/threonine-protein kinase
MALSSGTRLGTYEVIALIGSGGMGEVYRARDTRLKREVAIKVLPDAFAQDPDRLARFQREAELLATLNHPNIGAVYGFEQSETASAIVLELIEGETLAARIHRGAIPVRAALAIALQIAEALEAAHERGVIHRDLKPANIKLTPDDKVKVLDFGLAKALESNAASATPGALSHSPTLSMMATQAGMILGTAAYMSPEQAKGFPADQRSDIFAFGTVLYEMLTGRQPFPGETAPDVLASVIVREVDFNALPPNLNPRLRELLERCLEKNPKRRWQAVGDVRGELERVVADPDVLRRGDRRSLWVRAMPAAAAALVASVATAGAIWISRPASTSQVTRFAIPVPTDQALNLNLQLLAISPDGKRLVYAANRQLYRREMSDLRVEPINGTRSTDPVAPAFSPDGASVAFFANADRTLKRISLSGGTAVTVAKAPSRPTGLSWSGEHLFFGQGADGIHRVLASGGESQRIVTLSAGESANSPQLLPDGESLMFTLVRTGAEVIVTTSARVVVQSLASGTRKVVIDGGMGARYVSDRLVYFVRSALFAAPFDAQALAIRGDAVPIVTSTMRAGLTGGGQFNVSQNGTLVYIPDAVDLNGNLVAASRDGRVARVITNEPSAYPRYPRVSPDGRWVAVTQGPGQEGDVWVHDLSGERQPVKLTSEGHDITPVWTSDSRTVFYLSNGQLRSIRADGSDARPKLVEPEGQATSVVRTPLDFAPDGRLMVGVTNPGKGRDLMLMSVGKSEALQPWLATEYNEGPARFSPDGSLVAYVSDSSGRPEIWVRPFPGPGAPIRLSRDGGQEPVWSADGRELFYQEGSRMLAVTVLATRPEFRVGAATELFSGGYRMYTGTIPLTYDVARDGRFIVIRMEKEDPVDRPEIVVVLNWLEELKQREPTKRD